MKKKILIIDDDEEICEELSEILRAQGFWVETVSDGLAARALIERKPYHLLLVDLKIPTITGLELVEFVRKKKPGTKMLIVTARPMGKQDMTPFRDPAVPDASEQRLLKAAHGIIKKPFDISALLAKIGQVLRAP